MRRLFGGLLAIVALSVGVVAWAEDEKISLDKVPAKVKEAVKAKYPKAEIVSAELGDQDGKKVYEFDLKEGDKKWEVSFTPEGKFVSAEEPVAKEDDLPATVKEGFRKKYPDAKVVSIEKETSGEGDATKVVYEIVIEKGKGKVEVQFDPDGKFIAEEKVK
jgi:uncharacterized membrane protein YkoI